MTKQHNNERSNADKNETKQNIQTNPVLLLPTGYKRIKYSLVFKMYNKHIHKNNVNFIPWVHINYRPDITNLFTKSA